MSDTPNTKKNVSLLALLAVSFRVGVTSFGGSTAAWLHKEIVGKRGWLTENEFLTALTLAQVLPGANPVNLTIYVGSQLRGALGAAIAAAGMIAPPWIIILLLGFLYSRYGDSAFGHAVLGGLAAVGVGMTLSIGAKLARHVRKTVPILIASVIFILVGVLKWQLIPVVLEIGRAHV